MSNNFKSIKPKTPKADGNNVFVVTLSKGQIEANTVVDLIAMLMTSQHKANFVHMNATYVQQGREGAIKMALENEATHILFIDSDMMFPPETLDILLEADQDVVACNYASRTQPGKSVAYIGDDNYLCSSSEARYHEVETVGMGVCLINTKVFDKIPAPRCFMPWDTDALTYIGEDVFLCHVIREAGFHIFIDNQLSQHIKHIGSTELENP